MTNFSHFLKSNIIKQFITANSLYNFFYKKINNISIANTTKNFLKSNLKNITLSTSQFTPCELKIIHLIMPNLCFTFVVNISLSPSNSYYFRGNWVSLFVGNSYYFLGNWVSLDQICALFIYFFGYYPKVIVITLQATGIRDRIEHILLDFMGQFIIFFFEGRGPRLHILGQIENFLCVHTY